MRLALILSLIPFVASCGDKLGKGTFPQIVVEVENETLTNDGSSYFGQAIQQVVAKNVTISNGGTKKLVISSVDWDKDPDPTSSRRLKNPYVEIDWRGSVDANSFPWTVDTNNNDALSFAVEYTPPLGKPLDDFSESVLLIKSNAYDDLGRSKVAEFRVHFTMKQDTAIPRVTPISYNFQNATLAKGETQEFRIYNDADLATAPFHITNVYLETPSNEFTLSDTPSPGTTVLEPGNPGYADVVFKVTYQPKDNVGPDSNAIVINTDVGAGGTLRVPLSTGTTRGDYTLSYSHVDDFDFSHVTQQETRSVQITCIGPGPITLKQPHIDPDEARQDYTFKAFALATNGTGTDTEITSWPRGVNVGHAVRIDVTYQPATDGSDTANGQLTVPYENPDVGEIDIPLLSGKPKSKIELAPVTQILSVTGSIAGGDKGTRSVIVYNNGNGPLQVKGATLHADFDLPAKVWSLHGTFQPFTVDPGGLQAIDVDYDMSKITDQDGRQVEYLELTYYDDFLSQDEPKQIGLAAEESGGKANPVATLGSPSDYAGAVAGATMTLDASGSSAANGTVDNNSYVYYLTAKPAGSQAKLNVQTGPTTPFLPDVAGSYSFELIVYAKDGDLYLYSAPATLTVQVGAAP